ncbi:hypothetical protein C8R46DRAFT_922979 [Mycena filopes]|nr:hypothetical protein C8R46DRAFT_922979 [Mycena filopes]
MSEQLRNLRLGYETLERRVTIALRTQLGDEARLQTQARECARFLATAEQHQLHIPPEEYQELRRSIGAMTAALEQAATQSSDPLEVPLLNVMPITPAAERKRGRPRKEINKEFLAGALALRGPTGVAKVLDCHSRTVRHRALEHGLVLPGPPCYQDVPQQDGTSQRVWQSTAPPISSISNMPDQLDAEIGDILRLFPHFGRSMLSGALRSRGFRVPQDRIEASYLRLVTHAFIDGKSHFVTGIRVSNNNRAATVLDVFEAATVLHGWPSRVRVSQSLRSVHNIRIERLWVDYTEGIANKWVDFFYELELYYELSPDNPAHI